MLEDISLAMFLALLYDIYEWTVSILEGMDGHGIKVMTICLMYNESYTTKNWTLSQQVFMKETFGLQKSYMFA